MITFDVNLEGAEQLVSRLGRIQQLLRRPLVAVRTPLSRAMANEVVDAFRRRVDPQTNRGWSPLVNGRPSTGIRTGRLFASVRHHRRWRVRGERLVFNLPRRVFYGAFRQLGTGNQPKRGFLPSDRRIRQLVRGELTREGQRRWTR